LPGVLGARVGRSQDNSRESAVIVYLDKSALSRNGADTKPSVPGGPAAVIPSVIPPAIPPLIAGVRTVVVPADSQSVDNGTAPGSLNVPDGIHLPEDILKAAIEVQHRYSGQLLADPAIFGVGVTQSHDNPAEAALLVLVDAHRTPQFTPAVLGGLRVRYVYLDRFHVTKSKYAGAAPASSCSLPSHPSK